MTKGQFSLITGAGHCGTKWLSTVLHQPDQGVVAYHELAHLASKRWWKDRQRHVRKHGVGHDALRPYWGAVNGYLSKYNHLCDSQSWCPIEAAKVASLGNASCIIYLVRNGIQQLHSIANVSTWTHIGDDHWLYGPFLRAYWKIAGHPFKPWGQWIRWEKLCLWWASNDFMPRWVGTNCNAPVRVIRLEDLIGDVGALRALVSSYGLDFSDEQLATYQRTDVNRKVHGDRHPTALWATWSPTQQAAFRRICGDGMRVYGYGGTS